MYSTYGFQNRIHLRLFLDSCDFFISTNMENFNTSFLNYSPDIYTTLIFEEINSKWDLHEVFCPGIVRDDDCLRSSPLFLYTLPIYSITTYVNRNTSHQLAT